LRHFIAEDARVPDAMRAFNHGDREALNALSQTSQDDAARLLQNQTEETEGLAGWRDRTARSRPAVLALASGQRLALTSADESHASVNDGPMTIGPDFGGRRGVVSGAPGPGLVEIR
jgi:hypothetical protein